MGLSLYDDIYIDDSYKFIPSILKNEFKLVSDLNLAINNYSDHESQNIIKFTVGPELTIGNYKKTFGLYFFRNFSRNNKQKRVFL